MQYQVPQFIESEDKIIGPLTLKQFLYIAFAAVVIFVLKYLLVFYIWIIISAPIAGLAAAFAFLKINDRPFVYFFLSFLNYFTKPKLYIFSSEMERADAAEAAKPSAVPQSEAPKAGEDRITSFKLRELALNLDAKSYDQNAENNEEIVK